MLASDTPLYVIHSLICPSAKPFIRPFTHSSIHKSIHPLICLFIHVYVNLFTRTSHQTILSYMSTTILSPASSTHPSIRQFVHTYTNPPIYFSPTDPSIHLSAHAQRMGERCGSVSACSYYNALFLSRNIMRGTCSVIRSTQQTTPFVCVVFEFMQPWHVVY